MKRTWLTHRTLPALILLVAAGCADAGTPTLAEPPSSYSASTSSRELQKVDGTLPAFSVEAVIGPDGGVLGVPGYTLTVPRGSVREPVRFTFESLQAGSVEVRLTATSLGEGASPNDVGSRGFSVPVLLSFSYEPAGGMRQWARMVVAFVNEDGRLERVPSTLDPRTRRINGRIDHFSQYALATD